MSDTEHAPPTPPVDEDNSRTPEEDAAPENPIEPTVIESVTNIMTEAERKQALREEAAHRIKLLNQSDTDPQSYFHALFSSLIYWDKPSNSGIALAGTLSLLITSTFFSPIRFIAALWSAAILFNLIYVHAMLQYGRVMNSKSTTNPHELRMKAAEDGLLEKSSLDRWVSLAVDGINVAMQAAAKIILIEDTRRSLTWLGWGVTAYILAGWLSTKWILGLGILFTFTLPKLYIENKPFVDHHVAKASVIARQQADKAQVLAQQHAGPYYEKVTALGQQYGLVGKPKGE